MEYGKIVLFMGPMFSGKTTRLIAAYRDLKVNGKNPLIFRFSGDNRYGNDILTTKNGLQEPESISVSNLHEIDFHVKDNTDNILIDEGQFFLGLKTYALKWVSQGIHVTIAALDAYAAHPSHDMWPMITSIIPYSTVYKYLSCCYNCRGDAPLTICVDMSSLPSISVGGMEKYKPSCIACANPEMMTLYLKNQKMNQ